MGLAVAVLQYRKLKEQGVSFTFDGEEGHWACTECRNEGTRLDEEFLILSGSYLTSKNLGKGKDMVVIIWKSANRYYTKYCI